MYLYCLNKQQQFEIEHQLRKINDSSGTKIRLHGQSVVSPQQPGRCLTARATPRSLVSPRQSSTVKL